VLHKIVEQLSSTPSRPSRLLWEDIPYLPDDVNRLSFRLVTTSKRNEARSKHNQNASKREETRPSSTKVDRTRPESVESEHMMVTDRPSRRTKITGRNLVSSEYKQVRTNCVRDRIQQRSGGMRKRPENTRRNPRNIRNDSRESGSIRETPENVLEYPAIYEINPRISGESREKPENNRIMDMQ